LNSAILKIERAAEHIEELDFLLQQKKPFKYILQTKSDSGERSLFSRQDYCWSSKASIIAGDIVHNLRSAIDHAYFEAVRPHVLPYQERSIQFPFAFSHSKLPELIIQRLGDRVSTKFYQCIVELKPFSGPDGNRQLCLVNDLDIADKHKFLNLFGEYKTITSSAISTLVPDLPFLGEATFGSNKVDVCWTNNNLHSFQVGKLVPPTLNTYELELDLKIDIFFLNFLRRLAFQS
jgi:hypothetical protein